MSDLMQPQRRAVDSGADSDLCVQSRSAFPAHLVSFCVRAAPRAARVLIHNVCASAVQASPGSLSVATLPNGAKAQGAG